MEKKACTMALLALLLCFAVVERTSSAEASLSSQCATELQKVVQCLPFVTAKAATPTKDCCDSATSLMDTNAACICFFIQQIHNGTSEAIKSMGIRESRLLQLPSACKLSTASISECPRLLHLPPNSPDASIFTNVSTALTASTPVATPATPVTPALDTSANDGVLHRFEFWASLLMVAVGLVLCCRRWQRLTLKLQEERQESYQYQAMEEEDKQESYQTMGEDD